MLRKFGLFFGLSLALAACGDDDSSRLPDLGRADTGPACTAAEVSCNGVCVDTSADPVNCGACGAVCPTGESCSAGACVLQCPGTETSCDGSCADLQTSRANCGACGTECAVNEACNAGVCELQCPEGLDICGGACVDLAADRRNCGDCGTACMAGEVCSEGGCDVSCSVGLTDCDGSCRDTERDSLNCGACGTACGVGEICNAGTCELSCGALDNCGGVCADVQTDEANCGACGTLCGTGTVCLAGACESSCGASLTVCDGDCVDAQNDRANCGACGTTCAAGEACVAGSCSVICPAGQTVCSGQCVDTQTAETDCGACGTVCGAGEACIASTCALVCPAGQTNCSGTCVATASDPGNCGACGTACATGEACLMGMCTTGGGCGTLTDCGGACVDLQSSPDNCGACGTDCTMGAPTNGSGACVSGACVSFCNPGRADCNGGADGCETNTATSVSNCGACGVTCSAANATSGCDAGACTVAACDADFGDCDMNAANGCESTLLDDTMNCGACGNVCAGSTLCVAGTCGAPIGDQCSNAIVLAPGMNTLAYSAGSLDYLTTTPSCVSTGNTESPDIVASYTATLTGRLSITMTNKQSNQRHVMVLSDSACGTVTETACGSEFSGTTIQVSVDATAGTTYYLYIADTSSGSAPLPNPIELTVDEVVPTCIPGMGGVLAGTVTRIPTTGISSLSESYVVPDAAGSVYVGGAFDLYRVPKTGGAAEDIGTTAMLASANLGYDMLVDGMNLYTLDATTTGSGRLYRISEDGGATFNVVDYASFAMTPEDDFRSVIADGAQIYMMTEEFTDSVGTEIWQVDRAAAAPAPSTLSLTAAGFVDCSGFAADASYFYAACGDPDAVVRIDRTTGVAEAVTTDINLGSAADKLVAVDTTADGIADVLYVQSGSEQVYYVCTPTAAGQQFTGVLADWSDGTSTAFSYGLSLDPVTGNLWAWDDDTFELIRIQ